MTIQIDYDGLRPSDAVTAKINEKIARLERAFPNIMSGRVVVELPTHRHRKGNLFGVRIELHVPGATLIQSRAPGANPAHEDAYVAIRDAFDAVERLLKDHASKARREVKHHEAPWTNGKIGRLFPLDEYGFIVTDDGREIYFDANAVVDTSFDRLGVGSKVRFCEELGEKGAQATTVHA